MMLPNYSEKITGKIIRVALFALITSMLTAFYLSIVNDINDAPIAAQTSIT